MPEFNEKPDEAIRFEGLETPNGAHITFTVAVTRKDEDPFVVWYTGAQFDDTISLAAIWETEDTRRLCEQVLEAAGHRDARNLVRVTMRVDRGKEEEVGPALSHIPFMHERYAERPDKYIRPPNRVWPSLLLAMMRSHNAIIAKEQAEEACKRAVAELHELQVLAGMHEPSPL